MIFAALTALSLAAAAPDPTVVEGWTIMRASPDACQMVGGFGDHMMVSIVESPDGAGFFFVSDDRWILKEGDKKPGTISFDGWKTSEPAAFSALMFEGNRSVLVAPTGEDFAEKLSASNEIWVRVPGVEFDSSVDVKNAVKVIAAVRECNAAIGMSAALRSRVTGS